LCLNFYKEWKAEKDRQAAEAAKAAAASRRKELRQKLAETSRRVDRARTSMWNRADLSGMTAEKAFEEDPELLAVYIGGVKANVACSSDGDGGHQAWDLGNISYGEWYLHPSLEALDNEGLEAEIARWKAK
jgi:hypothetical protein